MDKVVGIVSKKQLCEVGVEPLVKVLIMGIRGMFLHISCNGKKTGRGGVGLRGWLFEERAISVGM